MTLFSAIMTLFLAILSFISLNFDFRTCNCKFISNNSEKKSQNCEIKRLNCDLFFKSVVETSFHTVGLASAITTSCLLLHGYLQGYLPQVKNWQELLSFLKVFS